MISDLFVLSSRIEGFAIVCIEAMAFGVPVISTKVAGPDEYIKDYYNGFLTEHNTKDMIEKISLFFKLDAKKLSTYKKNCLNTAKQFDVRDNVKKYEKLFLECLKN
jgi:glycosyltransferase involved in cell wall biosynthesis